MNLKLSEIFSLLIIAFIAAGCKSDQKQTDKPSGKRTVFFKIEGATEKIDSVYTDGTPRVSSFYDNQTNERIALVKFHDNGQPYTDLRLKSEKRNGESRSYYKDGTLWSINNYKDGVYDGAWKTYFSNGKPHIDAYYVNGLEDGEWTFYHPTGQIDTRGLYREGKRVGIWTTYNDKGQLIKETDFDKTPEKPKSDQKPNS